jgi:Na+/proline symporter
MGIFAMLFGTRHIDTTEHQDGMILAIAVESLVKLVAFIAVGCFVVFGMMGGVGPFLERAAGESAVTSLFAGGLDGGRWLTMTLLASFAIVLLPRQFHVAAVENTNREELRRAAWMFPAYLIAINIFVIPIAIAGLLLLPKGADGDTFVLALPVADGSKLFALVAFLGGLSASTAMVIVECVALSIMVCNNLVVPIMLRRRDARSAVHQNMGETLILIRRTAIFFVLGLAYAYYRMIGSSAALAQVGLISFAAVAQFAPRRAAPCGASRQASWFGSIRCCCRPSLMLVGSAVGFSTKVHSESGCSKPACCLPWTSIRLRTASSGACWRTSPAMSQVH